MPKDELLEEIGIPLTPVRLKCALLGLGVLKVALNKAKGTPCRGVGNVERLHPRRLGMTEIQSALSMSFRPAPSGSSLPTPSSRSASTTAAATLFGLEDRCTHDDGPLCEGDFDCDERVAVCPGTVLASTSRRAAP